MVEEKFAGLPDQRGSTVTRQAGSSCQGAREPRPKGTETLRTLWPEKVGVLWPNTAGVYFLLR